MRYIQKNPKRSSFRLWIKKTGDIVDEIRYDGDKTHDIDWVNDGPAIPRTRQNYYTKQIETYIDQPKKQVQTSIESQGFELVSNFIFEETFKVVGTYHDYSAGIQVENRDGKRFYYALADIPRLFELIREGKIVMDVSTGEFSGVFTFRKQGKKTTVYIFEEGKK